MNNTTGGFILCLGFFLVVFIFAWILSLLQGKDDGKLLEDNRKNS